MSDNLVCGSRFNREIPLVRIGRIRQVVQIEWETGFVERVAGIERRKLISPALQGNGNRFTPARKEFLGGFRFFGCRADEDGGFGDVGEFWKRLIRPRRKWNVDVVAGEFFAKAQGEVATVFRRGVGIRPVEMVSEGEELNGNVSGLEDWFGG